MENNKWKVFALTMLCALMQACDVMESNKLKVYNETKDTVFCFWTTKNNFYNWEKSPLFYSINEKDSSVLKNNYVIFPNDSSIFSSYNWKNDIKKSETTKINIYFFKLHTLKSNSWDSLRKSTKSDSFVSMSLEDLESNNWEVHFNK